MPTMNLCDFCSAPGPVWRYPAVTFTDLCGSRWVEDWQVPRPVNASTHFNATGEACCFSGRLRGGCECAESG